MKKLHVLLGASLMLAPFVSSQAQVDVVDASSAPAPVKKIVKPAHNPNAQLMYQLQLLQDEVMRMRGMLEEQQHQIHQLKQQRLDDYVELDKRLTALSQQAPSAPVASTAASATVPATATAPTAVTTAAPVAIAPQADERSEFNAAYALIKEKKFAESLRAFQAFVKKYPAGSYSPNAYYWLGKLLYIESRSAEAKEAFIVVVDKYPEHDKAPGSLYKVAEINYEQGNRDIAKQQMQLLVEKYGDRPGKVITNIVRNAREFLNKHYP